MKYVSGSTKELWMKYITSTQTLTKRSAQGFFSPASLLTLTTATPQMELYAFNPGPLDESVLYDQEKHVSSAVWEGQERGALRCHEHTSKLDQWILSSRQIQLIEKAGFGYLRCIPAISLDNPLISALVERWRKETNTFHLAVGEITVTLEDVALLLGLAIDGKPVIGVTYTSCNSVCEKYLGRAPWPGCTSGGMVKLSWLKECFSHCPEDASFEDVECYTRAYLLYLLGSTIFSTTTGNKVPVMYLPLFENFDQSGEYAWGAAALAFLYRALGNASLRSQSTVSGSLTLLQCWSYSHLNIGLPKLSPALLDQFPLVLNWKGKQSGPTSNRDVTFYRKALDSLKPSDVEWCPYRDIDISVIPNDIAYTRHLGRSKTMLICFDKAERHLPDRCLRQYGMSQPIPPPVEKWERKTRGVDGGIDLSKKMDCELKEWSERYLHLMESDVVDESEYMQWYLKITRRFVARPIPLASEFQRMNSTLCEVAHIADTISLQGLDNEQIQSITTIRYIVHECLREQAGSVVTVASVSSENENRKRVRGKEKVRKQSVGRRRRKGELDICYEDDKAYAMLPNPSATEIDYVHIHHPGSLVHHHQSQLCGAMDGDVDDQLYQLDHNDGSPSKIEAAEICIPIDGEPDASISLMEKIEEEADPHQSFLNGEPGPPQSVLNYDADLQHSIENDEADLQHSVENDKADPQHYVLNEEADTQHSVMNEAADSQHSVLNDEADDQHSVITEYVLNDGSDSQHSGPNEKDDSQHSVMNEYVLNEEAASLLSVRNDEIDAQPSDLNEEAGESNVQENNVLSPPSDKAEAFNDILHQSQGEKYGIEDSRASPVNSEKSDLQPMGNFNSMLPQSAHGTSEQVTA